MIQKEYISYQFMKYIKPIWYFHLKPYDDKNNVWFEYKQLSTDEKLVINHDNNYSSRVLSNWDASYQALMKGVVKHAPSNIQTQEIEMLPSDIYRFIRKYHKKVWLYLTFLQRIFFLFNPINEFIGLWKTRRVKNIKLFQTYFDYDKYPEYDSSIIKSNQFLNIIIPTFNRYESLRRVLEDLQKQNYTNFEVLIIDQSNPFQADFYNKFNLRHYVIRQKEPALWKARNTGIKSSKSDYLLFLDDDSRIAPDWISQHLKCLDFFHADISSGVSISQVGAKVPENYYYFRLSDQLDTGNVLIKKKVFEKCGLFDEQFEKMRMGDGEFGVRAYLNGFKNISNPKAYRKHLKIAKGGLRDMGHWDAFRTRNIFSPRPIPSVFYFWRKYWGDKKAFSGYWITIPFSFSPYRIKAKFFGNIWSVLIFALIFPIVIIQLMYSWHRSNKILKQGAIIEKIL